MQHTVRDYAGWKAMFDADPLDRKGSGVTAYRICRPVDEPAMVMIDLDFDGREEADQFLVRLRELWHGPASGTIQNVDGWVVEVAESAPL
jgi:ribosomal protein L35AE/L33A